MIKLFNLIPGITSSTKDQIVDFDGGHFIYQSDIDELDRAIRFKRNWIYRIYKKTHHKLSRLKEVIKNA